MISGNTAHDNDTRLSTPTEAAVTRRSRHDPRNQHGWRRIALNFQPAWFSANMGTGIASILLFNLPYNGRWLYWISVILFCLNVVLFLLFLSISIMRYTVFPGVWKAMLKDPTQAVYLGTFPMGLATIINMVVFVCVPAWGDRIATFAWALWWIDAIIALAINFFIPFIIMRNHKAPMSTMNASWLLPIVATIVASATGSYVADVLKNDQHALWTIITSYILWGCGVPVAMMMLVIYFQRLIIYGMPPKEALMSDFIPLGPLGQGSAAILQLGQDAMKLFGRNDFIPMAPMAGQFFYVAGILMSLVMWGFGLVWLFYAVASMSHNKIPFNLGWWAIIFSLGVYTVATTTLAKEMPSLFFKVLGTIISVIVVLLWIMVSVGTIRATVSGQLFKAPDIKLKEAGEAERDNESPA